MPRPASSRPTGPRSQTATINLGYTRIVAPFDGIVTSRAVDVGNLVTVGTATATPLFTVTDQSRLRIYVRVPQNYAPYIQPGMTVSFTVPEYPGRSCSTPDWSASAGAVASASGTSWCSSQPTTATAPCSPATMPR